MGNPRDLDASKSLSLLNRSEGERQSQAGGWLSALPPEPKCDSSCDADGQGEDVCAAIIAGCEAAAVAAKGILDAVALALVRLVVR
jgi:hypothetical protein